MQFHLNRKFRIEQSTRMQRQANGSCRKRRRNGHWMCFSYGTKTSKQTNFGTHLLMLQMMMMEKGRVWYFRQIAMNRKFDTNKSILHYLKLGFLDESHAIRDTPITYQLYKHIESTKEMGVSEGEAAAYLGQSKLNGRALIRALLKNSLIEFYTTHQQRQTVRR